MNPLLRRAWLALVLTPLAVPVAAGEPAETTRADAAVVVEGPVRQVFRAVGPEERQGLVELQVERAEVRRRLPASAASAIPVPGDVLFVRTLLGAGDAALRDLPRRGWKVRAHLVPAEPGGWQAVTTGGWEILAGAPPDPSRDLGPDRAGRSTLGLAAERIEVQGRPALRVTSVTPEGPAALAGLEVGDVILAAGGDAVTDLAALEALGRRGRPFPLAVLDVRTGKAVEIQVEPPAAGPTPPEPPTPPPGPAAPQRLGISAEVVDIGGRPGLKVVAVTPEGPAARAGIEVGDVLVAADGVPLTSQEALRAALATARSTMTITVRDVRTGRDTPVAVAFGAPAPEPGRKPGPEVPPAPPGPADGSGSRIERLGILADVGLHDVEAAVLVVEVLPGGAAARAGLRRGAVIFEAAGRKVLSPKALDDAVRAAGRSIRLGVADPQRGTTTLDVALD